MNLLWSLLPQLLGQALSKREPRYKLVMRLIGYLLISVGCLMGSYFLYHYFAFTFEDERKAAFVCLALVGVGLALVLYKRKQPSDPLHDILNEVKSLEQAINLPKIVNEHKGLILMGAVIIGFVLAQTSAMARKSDD